MKTFTLILNDATHTERIKSVTSFIGEDASGSFGILAGHVRMMTSLVFGLARFRSADMAWQYLALPGALLNFNNNELSISTRRYLVDDNYERISVALQEQLLSEEEELRATKESLQYMEEEIRRRIWELSRERKMTE